MIDHEVLIGGEDVSSDVLKISAQQTIETDSDPGKITITLANPHQKYTNRWPPQKTPFVATVYNWVYSNETERQVAGGKAQATYLVATGHITTLKADAHEIIVQGECDMGHLADALPKDFDGIQIPTTAYTVLREIISWHTDEPIALDLTNAPPDVRLDRSPFNAEEDFQSVVETIRGKVGALAYFTEDNRLVFMDPTRTRGTYNVDEYLMNPDATSSIMGFRNIVTIIGNQSLAPDSPTGATTPGSVPIIGYAVDQDSVDKVGPLIAPAAYAYNIKTQKEADEVAAAALEFYKIYKNAETKITVVGIVPPLQSIVSYAPFQPISAAELARANAVLEARLKALQEAENARAAAAGEIPRVIQIRNPVTDRIRGVVIAKQVEYSIDGLVCDLTISPGMMEMEILRDEDVLEVDPDDHGSGQQYPFEDD